MADGYSFSALQIKPASKSLRDPVDFHLTPVSELLHGPQYSCGGRSTALKLHVVMVPYPVQGQINPMVQLAKSLTAKCDDIMVTLVHNKHNYDCILRTSSPTAAATPTTNTAAAPLTATPIIKDGASMKPHAAADQPNSRIHLTWVENGLPPNFNYSNLTEPGIAHELHQSTMRMKEPLKQLLQSLKLQSPPVSCVLFGTFCPWAQSAAAELGIPSFLFWTQSAAVFSMYYHIPLLASNGFFPYNKLKNNIMSEIICNEDCGKATDLVAYVPGLPALHPSSFPSMLRVDDVLDPSLDTVREQFSLLGKCDGIIFNSFHELEKEVSQALKQELPCPAYFGGPLLPSAFLDASDMSDKTTGASLLQEKSDCIKWLDGKHKQSVLYISFGSIFNPSAAELEGIATGIKSIKQPYLWVMRPNSSSQDVSDILPEGFVEETKDYGLIIPWAPQLQVLSHPSVGAFLTHCGWNSTLESLSMGMPMISYPILLDQPANSTYVCDIWKVGMELKRQDDGKVRREDVEEVLRTMLQGKEGLQMRERAMELREAARQAVLQVAQHPGSSYAHTEKFIQALRSDRDKLDALAVSMYSH